MINLIISNAATIIICALLISAVIAVTAIMIKRKKSGKTSCGCSCSDCPMKGNCEKK